MDLNPNTIAIVGPLLLSGATWLYHKIKGEKTDDIKDALWSAIEGNAIALASSDTTVDAARTKLTEDAYQALDRYGVKRSAVLDGIIAMLVDRGITEVRKRILQRKALADTLASTATQASAVLDAFTPKGTIPKIGAGLPGEVTILPLPDAPAP